MLHELIHKISRNQVLLAFSLIAITWLTLELRSILLALFISYIIMAALNPSVLRLNKLGVPRVFAAIIVYLTVAAAIILIIVPLVPFFSEQIQSLFKQFPLYLDSLTKGLGFDVSREQIQSVFTDELGTIGQNAVQVTQRVFGGLFSVLSVIIISFYLLLDHDKIKKGAATLFHKDKRALVTDTLSTVEKRLGAWLRGQIILSFAIGLTTWLALFVIGVPFALPLALIAGVLEVIPTLGPILAAIPAVIIAFNVSPTLGLVTIGAYIIIQILENYLLVPKVMQKAVGLNPVIIILGIIIGSHLMGIAGALLSIPFIAAVKVILTTLEEN